MNRRHFLRNMLLCAAATNTWVSGNPLRFSLSKANAFEGKTLIKIFQRGGCDGLNMVVPYGEDAYYRLRPTIAIAPAGSTNGALDLDGFFGLHPTMTAMNDLFQQGHLAILPATHYPNGTRSHFDGQHYIENGQRADSDTGWLNRHLQTHAQPGALRAISLGNDLAQSLRGDVTVTTLNRLNNVGLGIGSEEEQQILQRLQSVYSASASSTENHELVHRVGQKMLTDLDVLTLLRDSDYQPANGADYPDSEFGRQLMMLANIIKSGVGLELANVNIGGWDTHSRQGAEQGRQAGRLSELSQGIGALYQDLGTAMDNVSVVVGTEFGRTSEENGSQGTDHGFAAAWLVAGGGVNGGIYGSWPGLEQDQLQNGRYLAMSTDYRDIYGDVLSQFLGNTDIASVLPGHSYQSLGLYSG